MKNIRLFYLFILFFFFFFVVKVSVYLNRHPSKHSQSQKRRYNVAATSRHCSDVVTTLLQRCVFAGMFS